MEVKAKVKARMRERSAKRRMLAAVPQADLVVMNPTHYAVALKYDDGQMAAPARGGQGRRPAGDEDPRHGARAKVPVLQAPPLARALWATPRSTRRSRPRCSPPWRRCWPMCTSCAPRCAGPPARLPDRRPCRTVPPELDPLTADARRAAGRARKRMKALMQRLQRLMGPATAQPAPAWQALMAPLFIVLMLAMMVLPLPPFALDLLFTFNIAMALMVMMVAAHMVKPLDFAALPTVLLVTTLLRLSLNVASTRVVLLEGHTGPARPAR
jgi:hypothetical protein